ncbi:MAG: hypothetical protein IT381_17925 [Deltaproteobacteria bacterium]|nr:hypothetical protein [Deltaproteobacteria bacterium]
MRTRLHRAFVIDVKRQVLWLHANARRDVLDGLRRDIADARHLLAATPLVGRIEMHAGDGTIRKLLLRRLPFVLWYRVGRDEVWLLRLFHFRQHRA